MTSTASSSGTRDAMVDPRFTQLYRFGGVAAALLVALTLLHSSVFFVVGLPTRVIEWYELYQGSALSGLLAFELLMVVYVILSVPVALALYTALSGSNPSLAILYLAITIIGAVAFVASRPAFEMLSLSQGYAAASTDAQRAAYLAAGESTLAVFHGTAFWVSYVLGSLGGLLVSLAILRSGVFSKATAYLRFASSVLDFGLFVPAIGLYIALFSVFCLLGFNILVARQLLRLAR